MTDIVVHMNVSSGQYDKGLGPIQHMTQQLIRLGRRACLLCYLHAQKCHTQQDQNKYTNIKPKQNKKPSQMALTLTTNSGANWRKQK